MKSQLSLVGVGPGDPELITLKAIRIIQEAQLVVYPQKPGEPSLALSIAESFIAPDARHMPIHLPMAIDRAPAKAAYDRTSAAIEQALAQGETTVYLCEGDPLFYGSAMYLIERLSHLKLMVIPGVTSLTATAAAAVRPLVARNETLKVLPAPLENEKLKSELLGTQSAVIVKVGRHFNRVRKVLEETCHAMNAVIVEYGTCERQKVTPLSEYTSDQCPYFSTILCYNGDEPWRS